LERNDVCGPEVLFETWVAMIFVDDDDDDDDDDEVKSLTSLEAIFMQCFLKCSIVCVFVTSQSHETLNGVMVVSNI